MITLLQFEASYTKLVSLFTAEEFKDDLLLAQQEFFGNAGTLDNSKPNYSLRMSQFYDWYFLTRKLQGYQQTPLEVVQMQRRSRLDEVDLSALEVLKLHKHSLYEFLKIKNNIMIVKNILTNEKIQIHVDNFVFSFDEKELFEARVVEIEGQLRFLKGFCFHPESAQKYILEQIKTFQKNPDLNFEEFLLRLNKMRYKYEQYKHVRPEMIYTNDNKLGL